MRWQLPLIAIVALSTSGCVTRDYIDSRLADIGNRVSGVEMRQDDQEARLDELSVTSRQALERATDAGVLAQGKFLYSVVLTDDGVTFDSNDSSLSAAARNRLSDLADRLKEDNRNVYMEIQGHTDSAGDDAYNDYLGQQRAEEVRKYLHQQGVALDRMATISYGEAEPVATNETAAGRASNRRVEVVVLD